MNRTIRNRGVESEKAGNVVIFVSDAHTSVLDVRTYVRLSFTNSESHIDEHTQVSSCVSENLSQQKNEKLTCSTTQLNNLEMS